MLRFLKHYWVDGKMVIWLDHISQEDVNAEYVLVNALPSIWYRISGCNFFPLIKFVAAYYNLPFSFPFLDFNFTDENMAHMPNFMGKKLLFTINVRFELRYKNSPDFDVVQVNYNVPQLFLFKSNLTELKSKSFIKFVHKCFNKQGVDINKAWYTIISASYSIRLIDVKK